MIGLTLTHASLG